MKSLSFRQKVYRQLKWFRFLPLAWQGFFRRNPLSLCVGENAALTASLLQHGWEALEKVEGVPVTIWKRAAHTLIVVSHQEEAHIKTLFKWLTRFARYRPLDNSIWIVETRALPPSTEALLGTLAQSLASPLYSGFKKTRWTLWMTYSGSHSSEAFQQSLDYADNAHRFVWQSVLDRLKATLPHAGISQAQWIDFNHPPMLVEKALWQRRRFCHQVIGILSLLVGGALLSGWAYSDYLNHQWLQQLKKDWLAYRAQVVSIGQRDETTLQKALALVHTFESAGSNRFYHLGFYPGDQLADLMKLPYRLADHKFSALPDNPAKVLLPPLKDLVMQEIQKLAQKAPSVDLKASLGEDARFFVSLEPLTISAFYTKSGYEKNFRAEFEALQDRLSLSYWKYGTRTEAGRKQLATLLNQSYAQLYIDNWERVLKRLQLQKSEKGALLKAASQPAAAWLKWVQNMALNTHLGALIEKEKTADAVNAISQHFVAWNHPEVAQKLQAVFQQMQQTVEKWDKAENPEQTIFSQLQLAFKNQEGLPTFNQLDMVLPSLPPALSQLAKALRQQVLREYTQIAALYLNSLWQPIVSAADPLLKQYPFQAQADQEITPADFTRLWGPEGIVNQFFQQNLLPFVSLETGRVRCLYEVCFPVKEKTIAWFQKASRVRQRFFESGEMKVDFNVQLVGLSASLKKAQISLLDQTSLYPEEKDHITRFSWQKATQSAFMAQVRLKAESGAEKQLMTEGVWAWLRLLQQATLTPIRASVWQVVWGTGEDKLTLQLVASPALELLLKKEFAEEALPKAL